MRERPVCDTHCPQFPGVIRHNQKLPQSETGGGVDGGDVWEGERLERCRQIERDVYKKCLKQHSAVESHIALYKKNN